MTIIIGHPTGNPNSHHAVLAHREAGRLEAFCVSWMPSLPVLKLLQSIEPLRPMAERLSRRRFAPIADVSKLQGRVGEMCRLLLRAAGVGNERLAYQANDWLMRRMARACRRPAVTAVHAYEDCALRPFAAARRRGRACIYDLPIGYYPAWEPTLADLSVKYADWLPDGHAPESRFVRPDQKREEMKLADLVLVPGSNVAKTVRAFHPDKPLATAPYGVDLDLWQTGQRTSSGPLRFIYAGQVSLRKGIPLLLEAWEKSALRDAELELVGDWQLAQNRRAMLPPGVSHRPPCGPAALAERFRAADVFVFPSYFEGFGMALLEAMACGLPAIATDATAAVDIMSPANGRLITSGNLDQLIDALRWFELHRDNLPTMSRAARAQAECCTWANYRRCVSEAVAPYV